MLSVCKCTTFSRYAQWKVIISVQNYTTMRKDCQCLLVSPCAFIYCYYALRLKINRVTNADDNTLKIVLYEGLGIKHLAIRKMPCVMLKR